jgi:5-hydroxyisourate hydrolase-like protein (transthyretin family)
MRKALVLFLFAAQIVWSVPAYAQVQQVVQIRVYLFNKQTGAPVPSTTVYFEQSRTAACPTGAAYSAPTGADGIANFTVPACVGEAAIVVNVSQNFPGGAALVFAVNRGQLTYFARVPMTPMSQSDINAEPSNKFFNQDRTLHIRVVGRAGGKLLPVHYAQIFDQQGNKIATTNYQGTAAVKHKEVVGETVTLRAVPADMPANWKEGWEPASASYIVGASEGTVRTTIPEDHITIVLNGNNNNVEQHPLDVIVRGSKPQRTDVKCRCVRVAGAKIVDQQGHVLGVTNASGQATVTIEVPLGEEYTVRAEAKHWITASESLQSGSIGNAGVASTIAHEHVEFLLQPNTNEQGNITVEVLDRETDKPIGGASVTLYKPDHFPGTSVGTGSTDAEGNSTFDAEEADRAMLNGEARIGVKHPGYESAVQTIAARSDHFVVYLKEKKEEGNAALTAGTPKLVGTIPPGWTMTTSSISYSYRSRPQSQKDTVIKGSWHVPTSIPPGGAPGSLTVSVQGGDLDGSSLGLGVSSSDNSALISCAGIKKGGGNSGCLDGDHASAQVSVRENETQSATQTFWIKPNGSGGKISISLPLGVHVDYVFTPTRH